MKKIINSKIKIALAGCTLILSGILAASCDSDLLDTAPNASVSSGNMWTTDNLTDLGMAGVYEALRLGTSASGASQQELYHYDRFVTSQLRDADSYLSGSITSTYGLFTSVWRSMYEGIHRANDALYSIPLKSPSAPEKKARLIAEAKFLRAYFYFRLNQLYRGVPIYLEPTTAEELNKPRNTEEEVWDAIIADLTDCINEANLPDKHTASTFGYVTKGAAYALRGKAYLYKKEYALASADFEKVGQAGYALHPDYATLFLEENEKSDEMIFSIQNMAVDGFGSTTQFYCGTRSSFGSCWNNFLIHPDVVDLYENEDGSPFSWDDLVPGYSAKPVAEREVYFLRDNATAGELTAAQGRGADVSEYLPEGNEARISAAYENRDPRLKLNVITPYSTYDGLMGTVTSRWPYRATDATDLATDTKPLFYYLHRKFVYTGPTPDIPNRHSGNIDFPIIRYADVLLMWAEALCEDNQLDAAIEKVNLVRARAGVGLLNSAPATTVIDQADLRNRIRNERRREFINEGISYFDELRWGTLQETVYYPGNGVKQIWGRVQIPYNWAGDQLYRWAIPQAEIEINTNLEQNPGWVN